MEKSNRYFNNFILIFNIVDLNNLLLVNDRTNRQKIYKNI